jgi:tetratricopeptide (TPR) repeat protein
MDNGSVTFCRRSSLPTQKMFLRSSLLIAVLFHFAGCSMYQNVTGYFNTYYNASKLFDEAVKEVQLTPPKDRDTNYFAAYSVQGGTQVKFDKVIEKCSKIIQSYSHSRWVDNGIVMIGESYVYLGEYEAALRKFKELFDNFPQSGLRFEAKLWSAKAQYYLKQDDEALKILKELFPEARAEGKNDVLLELLMLQGRIYTERGELDQAANAYVLAVEVSGDDAMRARAAFDLGTIYEKLGDYARAAQAYGRVKRFSPDPQMEFRARLKSGIMLASSEKHNEALKVLDQLNNEQLRPEEHGLVDLEIANTYWMTGDTAAANPIYNMIDATYKRTDALARTYYRRGVLYENTYHDYKRAREYYTKAKTEFASSEITPLAQRKAETFDRYFAAYDNLKKYRILYIKATHADTTMAGLQELAALDSTEIKTMAGGKNDSTALLDSTSKGIVKHPSYQPPDLVNDALRPPPEQVRQSSGGNNSSLRRRTADRDLEPDDEGDSPSVTSLRKTPQSRDSLALKIDSLKKVSGQTSQAVAQLLSPDSLRSLIVQTQFELGVLFYLELNQPDSSLEWYGRLARDYPMSGYVARALYVMADIYRAKQDSAAVDSLYNLLLKEHENSEYAMQVRRIRHTDTTTVDSDPAKNRYRLAEQLLEDGHLDEALYYFKQIVNENSSSPLAPKAAYAVGWIYEKDASCSDSAAAWYRQLVKNYPSTLYATTVQPKLAVKDKPGSLNEYIKLKEIESLDKTSIQTPHRNRAGATGEDHREGVNQKDDHLQPLNDEGDQNDDEPPDTSDDSDDDNNN